VNTNGNFIYFHFNGDIQICQGGKENIRKEMKKEDISYFN